MKAFTSLQELQDYRKQVQSRVAAREKTIRIIVHLGTCGISSGANFMGAAKIHEQLGPDSVVLTIFPDLHK